jgi:hypothetical protein
MAAITKLLPGIVRRCFEAPTFRSEKTDSVQKPLILGMIPSEKAATFWPMPLVEFEHDLVRKVCNFSASFSISGSTPSFGSRLSEPLDPLGDRARG